MGTPRVKVGGCLYVPKTIYQSARIVAFRAAEATPGDCVLLCDTSGPYTDENLFTDARAGLPKLLA